MRQAAVTIYHDILGDIKTNAPVKELRVCVRTTAVLSERLGMAYTFPRKHKGHAAEGSRKPQRLRELSARELAEFLLSNEPLEASVGLAAVNSLLDPTTLELTEGKANDLILEHGKGKNVTVVGHFPFVERLRDKTKNLWVLELYPQGDDLPAEQFSRVIPQSDVVALTATALINHTIEPLLELARDAYTIVLGPSTPLCPALFDWNVDAICGSVFDDPETALLDASEGISFRYMGGLRSVNALKSQQ